MLEEVTDVPTAPDAATEPAPVPAHPDPAAEFPVLVQEDLLVEDVSIDGMCGVY